MSPHLTGLSSAASRGKRRRGGAYTIAVLTASTMMLAVGSTLMMPTRLSLQVTELRRAKLAARELARSGLEWAGGALSSGQLPIATTADEGVVAKQKFSLSTGAVEVSLRRAGPDLLVLSRGVTSDAPGRRQGCELTARYARSQDRWVLTAIEERPIALEVGVKKPGGR